MNTKILMLVICDETITHLSSDNLHDCTFNYLLVPCYWQWVIIYYHLLVFTIHFFYNSFSYFHLNFSYFNPSKQLNAIEDRQVYAKQCYFLVKLLGKGRKHYHDNVNCKEVNGNSNLEKLRNIYFWYGLRKEGKHLYLKMRKLCLIILRLLKRLMTALVALSEN